MSKLHVSLLAAPLLALSMHAQAQQLETNDAGGALKVITGTSTENDPVAGVPVVLSIPTGDDVRMRLKGAANNPIILILGEIASTSTAVQAGNPNTEWFDLDFGSFLHVLVDGFSGGGSLPFFNSLDALGNADFVFPGNAALINQPFAFQGVVADPAAPFGLNFTAAVGYESTTALHLKADDGTIVYTPSMPLCFNGTTASSIEVSTNGFIRFDTIGGNDRFEDTNDWINGLHGAPTGNVPSAGIAMYWDDLRTDVLASSSLSVQEIAPGIIHASWNDFTLYGFAPNLPPSCGTMSCTIDVSSGAALVTMDWSATVMLPSPADAVAGTSRGIVGVTTGNPAATISQVDLFTSGAVNPVMSVGGQQTIFQNFNTSGPADLDGVTMFVVDTACDGHFAAF